VGTRPDTELVLTIAPPVALAVTTP
jgi:hypothetical protein